MTLDIILNKTETIRRCIQRIHEEYQQNEENLNILTKQDSIILNLQRACEACIDIAMHIVSDRKLGIPQNSRDAFQILEQHNLITKEISSRMNAMVGFRNIAVHDYQTIQLIIVKNIITHHINDFSSFAEQSLSIAKQ
ncbi:type VII toxin-antitoxin system HepT family RNase toxin [Cohnella silvisoli]|uniref:DUF86 domain-containing protein n=1 Tax=Cohnella silvisoli TaxID=2873699 RepID=A0ABV1KTI6_9BACL|nr:DUF86 domain-containing protein [Cohnella silvisoli]MCD9022929.1 DUF86 domain-containing protein [Cohnella silvisoli]